jgi:hypothetical protein
MRYLMRDRKGAMEGVPLQLIIVVVIAVAALAILVGWLAMSGDPDPTIKKVTVTPGTVSLTGTGRLSAEKEFTVFVYDNKDNEVDNVVMTFSGAVDKEVTQVLAKSGDKVKVTVALADGENTQTIKIKAEKGGGMGSKETTVIVMRG